MRVANLKNNSIKSHYFLRRPHALLQSNPDGHIQKTDPRQKCLRMKFLFLMHRYYALILAVSAGLYVNNTLMLEFIQVNIHVFCSCAWRIGISS